jgi:hypothetical protein
MGSSSLNLDEGEVMRSFVKVFAVTAGILMMGAPLALGAEAEVDEQLAEMRELVDQLKNQVDAQSEQIEHQGEVIREARIDQAQTDTRFGGSGLSAFIRRLEIDGHVAGSYFWNFNDPGSNQLVGGNTGYSGLLYPFHQNYNNFQVDQVWFGLEHPVDAENRAGFRFDVLYGNTACSQVDAHSVDDDTDHKRCRTGTDSLDDDESTWGDNTSEYYVHQAYVQYLAPITENGTHFKAGKFATLIGAEVMDTTGNFNITRGALYSVMQPIDHIGILASNQWGDSGWSTTVGVLNGNFLNDPDNNATKSVTAQLAWTGETVSVTQSVIWGGDVNNHNGHASGIYDLVATWDPSENLSTWVNFDWGWDTHFQNAHGWGIAGAGRYAVTERLGVSLRGEFLKDNNSFFGFMTNPQGNQGGGDNKSVRLWTLTGTVDYALTSNLMLRAEVRYDTIVKRNADDNEFYDQGDDFQPDQVTTGVEIVYEF